MVALMVLVGGITRLTESGLSMVEWRPITGILPPLTEVKWQEEFTKYQQFPEYQKVNSGITLSQFKFIYALEYTHRLLARITGLVFMVPFLWFLGKRQFSRKEIFQLIAILSLGGLQGVMGWLMVKSGLVDQPDVSHYRLAAHLVLAFILFGALFTFACKRATQTVKKNIDREHHTTLRRWSWLILGLVMVQVIFGAFVAGLNAGLVYNHFPLMGNDWIPQEFGILSFPRDLFENPVTVQWMHRILGMTVVGMVTFFWWKIRRITEWKCFGCQDVLLIVAWLQLGLGVLTLILHVPIVLASLHQMGALLLFSLCLYHTYLFNRPFKSFG